MATHAQAAESLTLDSRNPANQTTAGVPAASAPLAAGDQYVVTVTGTASPWAGTRYSSCGAGEASPMIPSPGAPPTVASWDAQTAFAAPLGARIGPLGDACTTLALPIHVPPTSYIGFQIGNGTQPYGRPDPVGGARTTPRSDHTYSYQITAAGGPLRFRFADNPVVDNSGVFSITVQTAAECAAVNCLGTAQPLNDQVTPPKVAADPGTVGVAGARACSLDRVLSVRIKQPKGQSIKKTVYYVNGKKERVVTKRAKLYVGKTGKGGYLRAQKFRNLPAGDLKLRIEVTLTSGQRSSLRRTVVRCNPRIKARSVTFS